MTFISELNTYQPKKWEKLKEDPGKGRTVAGLVATLHQEGKLTDTENMCKLLKYLPRLSEHKTPNGHCFSSALQISNDYVFCGKILT